MEDGYRLHAGTQQKVRPHEYQRPQQPPAPQLGTPQRPRHLLGRTGPQARRSSRTVQHRRKKHRPHRLSRTPESLSAGRYDYLRRSGRTAHRLSSPGPADVRQLQRGLGTGYCKVRISRKRKPQGRPRRPSRIFSKTPSNCFTGPGTSKRPAKSTSSFERNIPPGNTAATIPCP